MNTKLLCQALPGPYLPITKIPWECTVSISQVMKFRHGTCRVRVITLMCADWVRVSLCFCHSLQLCNCTTQSMSRPKVVVWKTEKGISSWLSVVPLHCGNKSLSWDASDINIITVIYSIQCLNYTYSVSLNTYDGPVDYVWLFNIFYRWANEASEKSSSSPMDTQLVNKKGELSILFCVLPATL